MRMPDLKVLMNKWTNKHDPVDILEKKVDEMIIHELMRESTLDKYFEEITKNPGSTLYTYEVSQRDYTHIMENIYLVQVSLPRNFTIMGQEFGEEYKVMFRIAYGI